MPTLTADHVTYLIELLDCDANSCEYADAAAGGPTSSFVAELARIAEIKTILSNLLAMTPLTMTPPNP